MPMAVVAVAMAMVFVCSPAMRVSVRRVSPVRVAVSSSTVLEYEDANQVDDEPKHRHYQEALVFHLGRLHQPFNGLTKIKKLGFQE